MLERVIATPAMLTLALIARLVEKYGPLLGQRGCGCGRSTPRGECADN